MNQPAFQIAGRQIGGGAPCFIVAEISANHNGSLERAVKIVRAARAAGADAVKLQTYTADTLTIDSDRECFRVPEDTLWGGRTLYQLYAEAHTPWEWHPELFRVAREEGLICFSTPFDRSAVDFLDDLGSPAYKVASFELVDTALLEAIGRKKKPVILSTGMATLDEIGEAVDTLRRSGATGIALLKCTSAYPAAPDSMNLKTIPHLQETFGVVAGLSDHTLGSVAALAAVALGASIVEKHFTLARADGGADSAFSMEPAELARMVSDLRQAEQAVGRVSYERSPAEQASLTFRRSLFVVEDVRKGEVFTVRNVRSIRPSGGLPPRELSKVLGRTAAADIPRGAPLSWDLVSRTSVDSGSGPPLRLRRALSEDCDLLFEWVNDPDVRHWSLSPGQVSYDTHVAWFSSRVSRSDCFMFILVNDCEEAVGQVRFELDDPHTAIVSASIARPHRGRGYASSALAMACDALRAIAPDVCKVVAYIRPDHVASRAAFERAGFVYQGTRTVKDQAVIVFVVALDSRTRKTTET